MRIRIGKSYIRRYYEDLLERFETEAKYINKKEEFEKRKLKITMELKEAYDLNKISLDNLHIYYKRLEQIRFENEKKRFSIQELKMIASSSKIKNGESGVNDKQDKSIDICEEKEVKINNKSDKEL